MSTLIKYIDCEKTTIAILRDYYDQQWKLENDPRRIRELHDDLVTPQGMSATPVHGGGSRREEALCNAIERITILEEGYRQAKEYNREFLPAWERLEEQERDVLHLRFVEYHDNKGVDHIMQKYNVSKPSAYRMINTALRRLSRLLFFLD